MAEACAGPGTVVGYGAFQPRHRGADPRAGRRSPATAPGVAWVMVPQATPPSRPSPTCRAVSSPVTCHRGRQLQLARLGPPGRRPGRAGHPLRRRQPRAACGPGERLRSHGRGYGRGRGRRPARLRRPVAPGGSPTSARWAPATSPRWSTTGSSTQDDAGLRRGLRAARGPSLASTSRPPWSAGRRAASCARGCSTCSSQPTSPTPASPRSGASPPTPARAAGPCWRRSTTGRPHRSSRRRCSPAS